MEYSQPPVAALTSEKTKLSVNCTRTEMYIWGLPKLTFSNFALTSALPYAGTPTIIEGRKAPAVSDGGICEGLHAFVTAWRADKYQLHGVPEYVD